MGEHSVLADIPSGSAGDLESHNIAEQSWCKGDKTGACVMAGHSLVDVKLISCSVPLTSVGTLRHIASSEQLLQADLDLSLQSNSRRHVNHGPWLRFDHVTLTEMDVERRVSMPHLSYSVTHNALQQIRTYSYASPRNAYSCRLLCLWPPEPETDALARMPQVGHSPVAADSAVAVGEVRLPVVGGSTAVAGHIAVVRIVAAARTAVADPTLEDISQQ